MVGKPVGTYWGYTIYYECVTHDYFIANADMEVVKKGFLSPSAAFRWLLACT